MKKRFLTLIFCLVASIGICTFFGCKSSEKGAETTEGNLTFIELEDGTYSVKAKDENISGEIVIPSSFRDKSVTKIENDGFKFCRNGITKITLPDTIKTVGSYAFFYCTATEIELADGITSLENGAFSNCTSSFVIPVSVTQIGGYAFQALSSIHYAGTTEQWNFVNVSETALKYNENAPAVQVICDGN